MPVAHTPNADEATYRTHFLSALREWIRTGVIDIEDIVTHAEFDHPTANELKTASEGSQDGSVAYNLNLGEGSVAVTPAIPHTEESVRAAEASNVTLPQAAYDTAGVERGPVGNGPAVPATTSTATASGEELADVSTTPGASPDNPEAEEVTPV